MSLKQPRRKVLDLSSFTLSERGGKSNKRLAIRRAGQDTGSFFGNGNEEQMILILGNDGKLLPILANTG